MPSNIVSYGLTILFAPFYFLAYYGIAALMGVMLGLALLVCAFFTILVHIIASIGSIGPKVKDPLVEPGQDTAPKH